MPTSYVRDLRRAFQGEVFGEALYAAMARLERDADRRAKLELLRALETEMKSRLHDSMAGRWTAPRESHVARALGVSVAATLSALPWQVELRLLHAALRFTVRAFDGFAARHAAEDAELTDFLARHERAQLAFVERELAGDGAHSLESVRALLDRHP